MLTSGKAVKVTLYLADGVTRHGVPVYASVLDFLFNNGIAGATVLKGVAGFGAQHRMHSAHLLDISDHLPVLVKVVDTREKIDAILPQLQELTGSGFIEVEDTTVIVPLREKPLPSN